MALSAGVFLPQSQQDEMLDRERAHDAAYRDASSSGTTVAPSNLERR